MEFPAPIRSRAAEEGNFEIPLWGIPFVLFLLYVCLFSGLAALGLVGPDEPRYAAIARAMAETNDWATPRLWGTPWFEKPILYYWTAGIAMRLFGVGEFAARLPSALAALLAVVAIKWTALHAYGLRTAWYALLILPTSIALIGFARAASPDMLFAGCLTAAMAVAIQMLQSPKPGPLSRIAFGLFLGAAVLAKGPAAVILAGAATLLWAAISGQWRATLRFLHPLVIAVFCATALPWYVLCALRNPDFLRIFIWQHNFQRYLTPVFEHRQPFWFYGPIFLLGILPWLPLLVTGFQDAAQNFRAENYRNSPSLFLACWAIFTLAFFSLSQSKLPGYILPAIPAAVLLLAKGLARQTERSAKGPGLAIACTGAVLPILLGIALAKHFGAFDLLFRLDPRPRLGLQLGFATTLAGGVLAATFAIYRRWSGAVCTLAATTASLLLFCTLLILPSLNEIVSAGPVARKLTRGYSANLDRFAVLSLPRSYEYGLDYYFGKALPQWTPEETQVRFLVCGRQGLEALAQFPRFADILRNKTYLPLEPGRNVFLVDLAPEISPAK